MSVCEVRPLQQVGGRAREESLAIVPDLHPCSTLGHKRFSSDSPTIGEELELLKGFPEPKRHCNYTSPAECCLELVENPPAPDAGVFTLEVTYEFGKEADLFTCGGNSPVGSSPSVPDFTLSQAPSANCGQGFNLQPTPFPAEFLESMHRPAAQAVLHPVAPCMEKYELIITEQPEEVGTSKVTVAHFFVYLKLFTQIFIVAFVSFCSIIVLVTTVKEFVHP